MRIRLLVLTLACTAVLAACQEHDANPAAETAAPSAEATANTPATPVAETPSGAFTVQVSLSPAAQKKLEAGEETVIVSADYFATPVDTAKDQANDVGQLDLGRAQVELPGAGVASFDGSAFAAGKLGLAKDAPQVNINAYSGRKSSPDNLLDCDMFQDTLAVAAKMPIMLDCRLIGEGATGADAAKG